MKNYFKLDTMTNKFVECSRKDAQYKFVWFNEDNTMTIIAWSMDRDGFLRDTTYHGYKNNGDFSTEAIKVSPYTMKPLDTEERNRLRRAFGGVEVDV